ncbi:MAG TPA: HAD family hydrolase [Sandaracinaceae bacterium LLY-WYZ-13_1]|nr:HAD family hydrolase [Sandaracinaceae bacterium LLY-WYZ-13_1]
MQGIVFDLDGTLVDSLNDIAAALSHVLGELDLPARDRAAVESFVGDGARMLVRRALGDAAVRWEDEALARFRARYLANLTVHTRPYEGVTPMLEALAARGVPTAVLSNKPHDATVRVVEALLPAHPFVAVRGHREGTPKKPAPDAALELAAAMGCPPETLWLVGDTPVDVETARAAGMEPVAVTWGMRTRAQLEAAGATRFVDAPAQVLALD